MFQNQPKGLYALALANTGERFGYYTMLAIFTLFLQAKFGFSSIATSNIFAGFLAFVYFLPIVGGILADKFGYGKMVTAGIIVMGNEGRGISGACAASVTRKLFIPPYPTDRHGSESLNVAVATAVICAEFRRRQM